MSGFNFCPACGQRLQPQFAVCPNCGMSLRKGEPQTSTSAPVNPQTANRPPATATPPQPQDYRPPHQWMDSQETPKQVVPLTRTETYNTQVSPQHSFACPDCGRAVSQAAMACPNCGRRFSPAPPQPQPQPFYPTARTSPPFPNWVGILLIALFAAAIVLYFC